MANVKELDELIEAVELGDDSFIYEFEYAPMGIPKPSTIRAAYHGSLDAAKALHEALLPGWIFDLTNNSAFVCPPEYITFDEFPDHQAVFSMENDNPARAWLIAIFKAYRAQVQEEQK